VAGGSVVLHNEFDAGKVLRAFQRYGCTLLFGAPMTFKMIVDFARDDFSHLRREKLLITPL
jgi:acyl-coenzyme A synthetase/AMP-(fatty) acid ligase